MPALVAGSIIGDEKFCWVGTVLPIQQASRTLAKSTRHLCGDGSWFFQDRRRETGPHFLSLPHTGTWLIGTGALPPQEARLLSFHPLEEGGFPGALRDDERQSWTRST
jgi:hypothetical protein